MVLFCVFQLFVKILPQFICSSLMFFNLGHFARLLFANSVFVSMYWVYLLPLPFLKDWPYTEGVQWCSLPCYLSHELQRCLCGSEVSVCALLM